MSGAGVRSSARTTRSPATRWPPSSTGTTAGSPRLPAAPLLAAELLSPSTRGIGLLLEKERLQRAQCPHYRGIDPDEPVMTEPADAPRPADTPQRQPALPVASLITIPPGTICVIAQTYESEPNDTVATADILPLGNRMKGSTSSSSLVFDRDHHAIDLPSLSPVALDLQFPLGSGDAMAAFLYRYSMR